MREGTPVFWVVTRRPLRASPMNGRSVWSSGLPQGSGRPRLWKLRTAVVDELGQGERVDRPTPISRRFTLSYDERFMRPADSDREKLSWMDPVGEDAMASADGRMSFEVMAAQPHRGPLRETAAEFIKQKVHLGLTLRQAQVVFAYDCGFTDLEIGAVLGRAPSTISAHRYAAYEKLRRNLEES